METTMVLGDSVGVAVGSEGGALEGYSWGIQTGIEVSGEGEAGEKEREGRWATELGYAALLHPRT